MNRSTERIPRRWSTPEASRKNKTTSTEESSSPTYSTEYSPHVRSTSTPLKSRRCDLEEINRSRRGQGRVKDTKEASSKEKEQERLRRRKDDVNRRNYPDDRKRYLERQKSGHNRREKRRRVRRSEETENEKEGGTSGSESSDECCYGDIDANRNERKGRNLRGTPTSNEHNELPITEILKRSQENARTKYEEQSPFPVLTTDKIYVQHRGGFSTMKVNQKRDSRGERTIEMGECLDDRENENSPPIRVAVMVQQFWKKSGILYQGLLGGMALMHFIMLNMFFNSSIEFVSRYSMFSEIYTCIFSFLIVMCILSTFDKFDLARFDVQHLRELYLDYNRAVIAVPLYLAVFCLHQICAGTDYRLTLFHYYSPNETIWQNSTNIEGLVEDLSNWHKISVSKDLLAVFAWFFVSLGNKDDSFLMYLKSMEKYANEIESSRH